MESTLQNAIENSDSRAIRSILLTEENYRIIFDNSALAITVSDANENIVVWNKCAETLFGLSQSEMFLKPVKELYPPEEWNKIKAASMRKKGPPRQMETKIITSSNQVIEVDLSISVLNRPDGSFQGTIGIIRDTSERKKAERDMQESVELSRGMIETAASGIFLLKDGHFTFLNQVMEEISGYPANELIGMNRSDLINPEFREQAQNNELNVSDSRSNVPTEFRIIRKDMETTWVSERLMLISHKGKQQILGNWMDITEWKIAEEVTRYHARQTELLLKVGSKVGQSLKVLDIVENFLDNFCEMLQERPAAVFLIQEGSDNLNLIAQRGFSEDFVKRMARLKLGKGFIGRVAVSGLSLVLSPTYYDPRFDSMILKRDNLWSLCSVPVFARDRIQGVICVGSREQTRSLEEETQLFELLANQIGIALDNASLYEKTVDMAFTDAMTGVYNRRYLMEELKRELSRANRNKTSFSIINMDIDNLKTINDRYGHNNGDRLLKEFGSIIQNTSRKTDIAARIGGDEFILLASESNSDQASIAARRILAAANTRKIDIKGEQVGISVSIGIAEYPAHGATIEEILNKADKSMYEAKKNGKNQIRTSPK
jgi:diguanylate cyclase (GGDEF)-like protein/PAS domain S-box-containing protein